MTDVYDLIKFEEGWRDKPYHCSHGYPTIGYGFKLGPKGAPLKYYDFTLPLPVGEAWLAVILDDIEREINEFDVLRSAFNACLKADGASTPEESPRAAVLMSMCYQMGVVGVAKFQHTLKQMSIKNWDGAAAGILNSLWATQTPPRAHRHAEQVRRGRWASAYGD